jgi:hypothetical protein
MRGRSEQRGRIVRVVFSEQDGTFVEEEETHPFLLRHHPPNELSINGAEVHGPCLPMSTTLPRKGSVK